MAETRRYGLTPQLDIAQILSEAPHRWLRPAEICEILRNYKRFRIETEPPIRPPSGSLFLFDRKVLRYFRKDGHNWRKKKDGKTVKEAHERLKSGSVDVLHCYYAHGEESANFQRRSYWMLEEDLMHIVLVHYREVKDKKETYCRTRDVEEFGQGSYADSPSGSNSAANYPQMTSPMTDTESRNSTHVSEFEDIESDKSYASSRYHPFPEVRKFDEQSLIDARNGKIYSAPSQSMPANQHMQRSSVPESVGYNVRQEDITEVLYETGTGFTIFNGPNSHLGLPHWEGVSRSRPVGMPDSVAPVAPPFDINNYRSSGALLDQTYTYEYGPNQINIEGVSWQDVLESSAALPVLHETNFKSSPGNETNPMFAALLKQLSLDLPNTDGDKGIQKNDSFSRWASKELDEVVDVLNSKSGIYWDEVENAAMANDSCLSPEYRQTYVMSPSLSEDQLFSIAGIFPSSSFAGTEIMVFVSGSFLVNKDDVSKYNWSCMFGQEEVPAKVIADGVLQCLSPACSSARVPFYVTCSNRFACSELREFEFLSYSVKDLGTFDPYNLSTYEMLLYTRLDRFLSTRSLLDNDAFSNISTEQSSMCNKISSLLFGTNDELSLVLKKASYNDSIAEKPNDLLMQTLLKDKLHFWLVKKVVEGGKGPSVLDKDGQGVIHLAAALGYNWAIAPLLAAGLNINFRDVRGWTALHWAASYGRESTIVALLSLGANSGALTDPTPEYPSPRLAAELASCNGHKGIGGFLAESSLTTHLSSLNLRESRRNESTEIPRLGTSVPSEDNDTILVGDGGLQADLSLKDSLSAVRNAAQAASRIYQVYRLHSFQRKKIDVYKEDKFGISDERALSLISVKTSKITQHDEPGYAAAVKIQKKFRGWKRRKDFLIIRQNVVKIQAHVRGYQVRKHFRKIVWSVGIVEKAILRWRRKGCGLRGFRSEGLEGTSMQVHPVKEDDYDFLREGRKQTEERLERALARVKSMVQYPEARDQYRRLLTGIEEFQESKVILERILNDEGEPVDEDMMFDIDELIGDDGSI